MSVCRHAAIPAARDFLPGKADGSILPIEKGEQRTYNRPHVGSRRLLVLPLGPGKPMVKLEEYTSGVTRGRAHKRASLRNLAPVWNSRERGVFVIPCGLSYLANEDDD